MKTLLGTLCIFLALTVTAAASPALTVALTITEHGATVGRPTLYVRSGKEAAVQLGSREYAVTATLLEKHMVKLNLVVREHVGAATEEVTRPLIITRLGRRAEVHTGNLEIETVASLAR